MREITTYLFFNQIKRFYKGIHWAVIPLFLLQYLIGELWHLYPETGEVYPTFFSDHFDTPQWICKEITQEFNQIIIATILLLIGKRHDGLKIVLIAYLTFTIMDMVAYFIDYKRWEHYSWVYYIVMLTELTGLTIKHLKYKKQNL